VVIFADEDGLAQEVDLEVFDDDEEVVDEHDEAGNTKSTHIKKYLYFKIYYEKSYNRTDSIRSHIGTLGILLI